MSALTPATPVRPTGAEFAIEAVAALDAVSSVFSELAGGIDVPLSEFFTERAWALYSEAGVFRPSLELEDEEYETYAPLVAISARSAEIAGEALMAFGLESRASAYLERSRRIRETGTSNVQFCEPPTLEERRLALTLERLDKIEADVDAFGVALEVALGRRSNRPDLTLVDESKDDGPSDA